MNQKDVHKAFPVMHMGGIELARHTRRARTQQPRTHWQNPSQPSKKGKSTPCCQADERIIRAKQDAISGCMYLQVPGTGNNLSVLPFRTGIAMKMHEKAMSTEIIVIGAGGHAASVSNVATSCGYNIISYVDDRKNGEFFCGAPVISRDQIISHHTCRNFVIAVGDNFARERVANEIISQFPDAVFPTLVHSSSVVGLDASLAMGVVVMPLSNIGPFSMIGQFCIVNTMSSIDHDCEMADFASLAPGVISGGNVSIGQRSAISIGATIKHGIRIGSDTVIGAQSYVDRDVENEVVAYGTPCRVIRPRSIGARYL